MPTARAGLTCGKIQEDKIVICVGGRNFGGKILKTADIFDHKRNTWRQSPLLESAFFNGLAVSVKSDLFFVGKIAQTTDTFSTFKYNNNQLINVGNFSVGSASRAKLLSYSARFIVAN